MILAHSVTTQLRPITVEEYYRMAEVGILQPDEKLELINGQIKKNDSTG